MRYEIIVGLIIIGIVAGGGLILTQNSLEPETHSNNSTNTSTTASTTSGNNSNYPLSPEEVNSILFMREEEKLARDVYLKLYEVYGLQIFQNIARSEQRHMDAVLTLIEKYNLTDPAIDEVGVFSNESLQELYNQLVERGSSNLTEAILVGALIEEKDIIDINNLINKTDNPDIIRVFSYLVNGSAHHLAAFANEYESLTSKPYQPQLLTPQKYSEIISSISNGPNRGGGPNYGGG